MKCEDHPSVTVAKINAAAAIVGGAANLPARGVLAGVLDAAAKYLTDVLTSPPAVEQLNQESAEKLAS